MSEEEDSPRLGKRDGDKNEHTEEEREKKRQEHDHHDQGVIGTERDKSEREERYLKARGKRLQIWVGIAESEIGRKEKRSKARQQKYWRGWERG